MVGCMVRYVAGNVLRKYGLYELDLRIPVCFQAPWFYVRIDRCIRRNKLENVSEEMWGDGKKVCTLLDEREQMEEICGLTLKESKEVWKKEGDKELSNRQKDLSWMCVHECVPTRVFQRRRKLVDSQQCPREGCNGCEGLVHVFWECGYAKQVWAKMKGLIKGLTGVELLSYGMMMYGLSKVECEKGRVLWFVVNCVKEALWDSRNVEVFRGNEMKVDSCVALIRSRIFLYVLSDRKKFGDDAEGIWKYRKWKSWFYMP
ncbi:hypothetical protein XELAEV_18040120mg [Xenopus laevis]|uniref:Reverse transcriptase zinc-binding domain-containing protein n=1 Tax=Xenopus laevis TaxID=8355 RepID=A0A974H8M1_XENLA|nr:hypothetical protein XELAEV_18040120mg [Xenopus laevis]